MEITPTNLAAMFTSFDTRFQAAYQATDIYWEKFAMLAPSATGTNTYAWMGKIPTLRKWVGDRIAQNVQSYSYSIINDDYELTLDLDRNTIEDDEYGIYTPTVDEIGWQAKRWPDFIQADLFMAGDGNLSGLNDVTFTAKKALAFDGLNFFNAAHPINPVKGAAFGTYSNYNTGLPLTPDNYQANRVQMSGFKGEDGKALGLTVDTLMVAPALEGMGKRILESDRIALATQEGQASVGATDNIYKGTAQLIVNPLLAGRPKEWYTLCTKRPIKPTIFQLRKAPEFVYFNAPNSEPVFNRRKFVYGVAARGAGGYTLPFLAIKNLAP